MSWLTLASLTKLLFLLLPIVIASTSFSSPDLDNKSAQELEEYRRHLSDELARVSQKVEVSRVMEEAARKRSRTLLSPLSASLPNHDSPLIMERLNSLKPTTTAAPGLLENTIDDDEPFVEVKEKRVDETLIALLNSLDDLPFEFNNSTTVEGSGEEESPAADAAGAAAAIVTPTTSTTAPSTTHTPRATTEAASSSTLTAPPAKSITESARTVASTVSAAGPTRTTAAPAAEMPRRAHGVVISHASPHSPSLSPMMSGVHAMTRSSTSESGTTTTTRPSSSWRKIEDTKRPRGPSATRKTMEGLSERDERREPIPTTHRVAFNPTANHTADECRHLTQLELVRELKQKGTYNPDLMAWDVFGILRFLDRTIAEQYEMQMRNRTRGFEAAERNLEALSRILGELDVSCDVKTETVRARMQNMTMVEPRRTILSPHIRRRSKREAVLEELTRLMADLDDTKMRSTTTSRPSTTTTAPIYETVGNRQRLIGESHVVPFGCDRRGTEEDGYLRLCSACQSIRRLPDSFFPPFINEVTCDEDNACLYFYDYPHGRCKQKHMNFVVLRNLGTQECQIWRKFNLNVRVSCECFVDEMSFFAKYV